MAFSCDKPGTVEIQTYVRLAEKAKYYTGTQTIQVTETKPTSRTTVILSIGSKQMIVNNGVVQMDAAPVIRDGRTYVPLRALGDIFGAQCSYDTETGQILVRKAVSQNEQTTVVLTVGASTYQRNGETDTMDAPAYIVNGRTMVPVRFVAEALGIVLKPTYTESGAVADILFQM